MPEGMECLQLFNSAADTLVQPRPDNVVVGFFVIEIKDK